MRCSVKTPFFFRREVRTRAAVARSARSIRQLRMFNGAAPDTTQDSSQAQDAVEAPVAGGVTDVTDGSEATEARGAPEARTKHEASHDSTADASEGMTEFGNGEEGAERKDTRGSNEEVVAERAKEADKLEKWSQVRQVARALASSSS